MDTFIFAEDALLASVWFGEVYGAEGVEASQRCCDLCV